jgi:hypothetical protein
MSGVLAKSGNDGGDVIVEVLDDAVPDRTSLEHDASAVKQEEVGTTDGVDSETNTVVREQILDREALGQDFHRRLGPIGRIAP